MSKNEIGFLHYRRWTPYALDPVARGGYTLAYRFSGNNAIVSIARCSEKDNYCKAAGREVALGRLDSRDVIVLVAKDRKQLLPQLDALMGLKRVHRPAASAFA